MPGGWDPHEGRMHTGLHTFPGPGGGGECQSPTHTHMSDSDELGPVSPTTASQEKKVAQARSTGRVQIHRQVPRKRNISNVPRQLPPAPETLTHFQDPCGRHSNDHLAPRPRAD